MGIAANVEFFGSVFMRTPLTDWNGLLQFYAFGSEPDFIGSSQVGPIADRDQRPIRDGPPDRGSLSEAPDRARSV
jgi:hypothetical protein